MDGSARVVWVFVDGLGLAPPSEVPPPTPRLDALVGGPALVDRPLAGTAQGCRWELDATLGVAGLPGTATGQATLVTGANAAAALGRHIHGYPGPRLRAFIDAEGSLFQRVRAMGRRAALLTAYPEGAGETALRYAARRAGAALALGEALLPHLGCAPGSADAGRAAEEAAAMAARLAEGWDLAVVETDLCDRAGHLREGREEARRRAVACADRFLAALRARLGRGDVLAVTSDHGNVESERRGHSRNRVPLFALGACRTAPAGGDLTAFAPWLVDVLAGAT
ncbi:MAG: alkaline phosphatase family protein [Firmicutes bacterium]|nr:alkaline phosphatase family protein [Bacillota bacterium]